MYKTKIPRVLGSKVILISIVVCALLLTNVVMAEEPIINEGTPVVTDTPIIIEPLPIDTPIAIETLPIGEPIEVPYEYELASAQYVPYTKTIIQQILEFFGITDEPVLSTIETSETTITVLLDDQPTATIPVDSKFAGMEVHTICLRYQYGTDWWYECEQELL
jgi:hypothetical protein